jgi:hypothetical protein
MRTIDKVRLRLRSLFRKNVAEAELKAELLFHLENLIDENVCRGMSPSEAALAARRKMGGIAQFEEECRDKREINVIENLWRDLWHGTRVLRRSPGFTVVAVLTLGLGIGATTAIFSVIKSVLLDPLPYNESDRIVALETWWTKQARASKLSGGDYPDLITKPSPFAASARYVGGELPVRTGEQAEFVPTFGVDADFGEVFRIQPVAGRLITRDEYRTKAPLALVSHSFATRNFGAPNLAIGRTFSMEGRITSIVGVFPAGFQLSAESRYLGADVVRQHEPHCA